MKVIPIVLDPNATHLEPVVVVCIGLVDSVDFLVVVVDAGGSG